MREWSKIAVKRTKHSVHPMSKNQRITNNASFISQNTFLFWKYTYSLICRYFSDEFAEFDGIEMKESKNAFPIYFKGFLLLPSTASRTTKTCMLFFTFVHLLIRRIFLPLEKSKGRMRYRAWNFKLTPTIWKVLLWNHYSGGYLFVDLYLVWIKALALATEIQPLLHKS